MLLAIDVGNSHTVFAVCEHDTIRATMRMATDARMTSDVLAVWLSGALTLRGFSLGDIDDVRVCSVVPACDDTIAQMVQHYLHKTAHFLTPSDTGITIDLPHPETVGMDRLVNAVAAVALYGSPVIVIDFGTATTFDVVDGAGAYIGGMIAPGPEVSLRALSAAAAKLPPIALSPPPYVLGKTTQSAMQSGVYYGYLGMIEGLLSRLITEVFPDTPPKIIATGGLSNIFAAPLNITAEPDLTIRGMLALFEKKNNRGQGNSTT